MEQINVVGLVELDRSHMGGISGGTLAPTRDTSFWYDVAYVLGYSSGCVVEAFEWIHSTANTGSYSYAKNGTP
jgi:hypothetical protein